MSAHVAAKLQRVSSHNFADAVTPLKRVSNLGQLAFAIVADVKTATYLNKRKSLVFRTDMRVDASRVAGLQIVEAERSAPCGKSSQQPRRRRWAGILYGRCEDRVLERSLPLAVVVEPKFIDSGITQRPGVGEVPLLIAVINDRSETGHTRPCCFEHRERRNRVIVVKVVIDAQVLLRIQSVIEPHRELIATRRLHRRSHQRAAGGKRSGDVLQ